VSDWNGDPVAGVRVRLMWRELFAVTDASGHFEFHELDPGTYQLEVTQESLPPDSVSSLESIHMPRWGENFKVELRIATSATLIGRILGPAREPVGPEEVRLVRSDPQAQWNSNTRWDANGRFRSEGVWPGDGMLEVVPEEASTLRAYPRPKREFHVEPGDVLDLGDIIFSAGPCSVRGRVIDQDGRALERVAVECAGIVTTTNALGEFELAGLEEESYELRIGSGEHEGFRRVFAADERAHAVKLDLAGATQLDLGTIALVRERFFEVRGRILPGESGLLPQQVNVRVESAPSAFPDNARTEHLSFDALAGTFECFYLPETEGRQLTFIVWRAEVELERRTLTVVPDGRVELPIELQ
jgi:hypothetical protein